MYNKSSLKEVTVLFDYNLNADIYLQLVKDQIMSQKKKIVKSSPTAGKKTNGVF